MPMTKVYLRTGSTAEHRRAISDAIHDALVEVLGIPDDDRYHIFHELEDGYLVSAPVAFGLERRREAVFVQYYFGPRQAETLHALYAATVRNLGERTGLTPADIFLNVVPSPSDHWWAHGRVLDPSTGYDERMTRPDRNARS